MKVKFKKLDSNAVTPIYAGGFGFSNALDFTAIWQKLENDYVIYGTGLAIEIPIGYSGLILPRSSVYKKDLVLSNSVGLIDSKYRGEIRFIYKIIRDYRYIQQSEYLNLYRVGDRIGQLLIMPTPRIELMEVEQLSVTERGENGFGSTD